MIKTINKSKKNIFIIFVVTVGILSSSYFLTQYKIGLITQDNYKNISSNIKSNIDIMIENKKKLTIFIALALSQNSTIINSLDKYNKDGIDLNFLSKVIKHNSSYENLWYQILDTNGNSFYRSWTNKSGDSLLKARPEIVKIIEQPQIISTISTGKFAMTFKSMVPIYNNQQKFIGIFEVISHFNSISKELLNTQNIKSIFIVDKKYKKQITKPFSPLFIDDYYITSLQPDQEIIKHLKKDGIEHYLDDTKPFVYHKDCEYISITYPIPDINGNKMGYSLVFVPIKDVDSIQAKLFKNYIETFMIALVLIAVFIGYIIIKRDHQKEILRQYKAHEEDIVKSTKFLTIGQMAAGITHEINTPLTYIKGTAEMSKQDISEMPESKLRTRLLGDFEVILSGINRLAIIVESMKEMSHSELKTKEKFNIYSTLIIVLRMLNNRSKQISPIFINDELFDLESSDKNTLSFMALIHIQRVEQVWTIILNNALDELQKIKNYEDRRIDISINTQEENIIVRFADSAGGVDPKFIDKIFEPFTSTKASSGLGIGLYVAKKIIEEHNGSISVSNTKDGACFKVVLPLINE